MAICLTQFVFYKSRIFIHCLAVSNKIQNKTICRSVWNWTYGVMCPNQQALEMNLELHSVCGKSCLNSNFGLSLTRVKIGTNKLACLHLDFVYDLFQKWASETALC